jgi:hypothetical protein
MFSKSCDCVYQTNFGVLEMQTNAKLYIFMLQAFLLSVSVWGS